MCQSVLARNKEQENLQNGKPVSSLTIKIWQKSQKVCTGKNQLLEKRGIRHRKGELSPQKQLFKCPGQLKHIKEKLLLSVVNNKHK